MADATKKPMLTLVAYRPNSEDYFRGHTNVRYNSDFAVETTLSEAEAVALWAGWLFDSYQGKIGQADWETKLLIDGREPGRAYEDESGDGQDEWDAAERREELCRRIEQAAEAQAKIRIDADKAEQAAQAVAAQQRSEKAERQRKLEQLAALHKELFGG